MTSSGHSDRGHAAELVLAFVGLLWLTHGLDYVAYEILPKVVVRVFALALFTTSIAILLSKRRERSRTLIRSWPVWIAPAVAVLSVVWSEAPDLTLRRATALLGTTCFGVFVALRLERDEWIRVVAACILLVAGLSVFRILFVPELGLSDAAGGTAWRGVYGHKNYLGRAMALGALGFLLLAFQPGRWRWAAVGVAACVAVGLASRSVSGIISIAVTLAAAVALRAIQSLPQRVRPAALAIAALIAIVGGALAIVFADQVLSPLGRDSTLTGRLYIWRASWKAIELQPWLGYGYGAVWYTGRPGISDFVTHHTGFDPLTAHSGYFDLFLELGAVGLIAVGIPYVIAAVRGAGWLLRRDSPLYLWPLAYLVFFTVANVAESELLRHNSIFWVLFVATVADLLQAPASPHR